MGAKTVPQRLLKKHRAHLKEMGIEPTMKAIKLQIARLLVDYKYASQGCRDCAEIAHRLGIKTTREETTP